MGPLTTITYYIPHIIQLKFSTKYAHHITTKIGPQITLSPQKAQHHLACGQNSKKAQIPCPTTMWLIPKVPLRCGKFKAHYDVALFTKTAMMRHYLQSPLLHSNTLQNLKIIFTKSKFLFGTIFQSPNSHLASIFYKAQNPNLALFYKVQILFWQFFRKAQILIWRLSYAIFYKSPNANLAFILQNLKPFWQLSYKTQNSILAKAITLHSKPKC